MAFDMTADIAELLAGVTSDVYDEFPSDKDACIAVIRSEGDNPEHTFGANTRAAIIHPTIKILIRHTSKTIMLQWWDGVVNALDGVTGFTPAGTSRTYLNISQQGDILNLGRDDSRRHVESLNFTTSIINAR